MLNDINFISQSIVINLAYGLSIREMALNLELSFLSKNNDLKEMTDTFFRAFDSLVEEVILVADKNVPKELFDNREVIFTEYTLYMYDLTEKLTGINMNQDLILRLEKIKPGIPKPTSKLLSQVEKVNKRAKELLNNFKTFLKDIYDKVIKNDIFVFTYGLLIEHLIDRINLYYYSVDRLIHREDLSPTYVSTVQYDFNKLVMQDSMFINGFVNQSEKEIIDMAREFEASYDKLLKTYQIPLTPDNQVIQSNRSLNLNNKFISFVSSILEKIKDKKVQFMVEPVFIDLILRESNLFSFILSGDLIELSIDYQNNKV